MWPFVKSSGLIPLAIYGLTVQSLQAGPDMNRRHM